MASSPLTLALLAGQNGIQDPAFLPAARKLGVAQQMLGTAMDASPAYPVQALARALTAIPGAYLLNGGENEFKDVTAGRQKAAADALQYMRGDSGGTPGMSSLASALTGPAPSVQPPPAPPTPTGSLSAAAHQLESGGRMAPGIVGDGGAAAGPMQVHQAALTDVNRAQGTNYTLDQLTADPALGKRVGDAYLAQMQARFPDHPELALAAYNAGPTATQRAVDSGQGIAGLPPSTQAYVAKGIAAAGGGGEVAPAAAQGQPQTGLQAPMVAKAMEMFRRAQEMAVANPYNPAIQEAAKMAIQQAQMMMGLDQYHVAPDGTQTNLRTGQQASAAQPLPHYVPNATGAVDITGTHPPAYMPSPRVFADAHGNVGGVGPGGTTTPLATNPSGFTGNTPEANAMRTIAEVGPRVLDGTASPQERASYSTAVTAFQNYQTQKTTPEQALTQAPARPLPPGMPAPPGATTPQTTKPADTAAIASQASAKAQGTETGHAAVLTSSKMFDLGREADQAIGNIDYGMNQLNEAAKGGITSGYFAPWLAHAAAAGKSLGIDLRGLGIDPAAVGNVQSAQKTLGVVAGTILQNTIGKDSQITDAKIEHFIHTQPGIETDPQAIQRIMNWARSQFAYNREMAMDAMQHTDPAGMLPPGWKAGFVTRKGAFAPIYDPTSQEMKQPTGSGPPPEAPPLSPGAPAQNPQAPVPGAQKAPDGKWYVPDPKRAGKYLEVR